MNFFLIPVYNEFQNLDLLFENLNGFNTNQDKFYVFVDDCSTDQTVEKLNTLFKNENFHIIKKEKNGGPGDSFNLGFEWILQNSKNESDLIITMEGDNTSDIELLPKMVSISQLGFDLVLASVYAQGGGFDKTSIFRKILSFFANMFFRLFFNLKILTLSSFYRVYTVILLKRIKSQYEIIISEPGFISMLEILLKSVKCQANIIEVPMLLKSKNRIGKSKMKIFKTGVTYLKFLFSARI